MKETVIAVELPRRYAQLPRGFRWFSEHCVLRRIDDADAPRIWNAVMHPSAAYCWTAKMPQSQADVEQFVRASQGAWLRGTCYTMSVIRKQTQDFVGWIELRSDATERGAWALDWFIHPTFVAAEVARDILTAVADLMFSALDTRHLRAECPANHMLFETLLDEAGFVELVPAGSLDHKTMRPRALGLFTLGRADWLAKQASGAHAAATARPLLAPWATDTLEHELALV
jgi:RimJ/RimL family protein N-acetyltransferase